MDKVTDGVRRRPEFPEAMRPRSLIGAASRLPCSAAESSSTNGADPSSSNAADNNGADESDAGQGAPPRKVQESGGSSSRMPSYDFAGLHMEWPQ